MTLLDIAERCEAATGPDRELDVLVEIECGPTGWKISEIIAGSPHNTIDEVARDADRVGSGLFFRVPRYTASIDAARTLIPEWPNHGGYRLTHDADLKTKFFAELWEHPDAEPGDGWHKGRGASLALAICAAALRAIAAATGTAKTPQAVECEASQSGGKAASPGDSR